MEFIVLLAIGIVIGIPAIAIGTLVRSGAAEKRIEESRFRISYLQGDVANLVRELARLSDRVVKLEASHVAPSEEDRGVRGEPAHLEVATGASYPQEIQGTVSEYDRPAPVSAPIEPETTPTPIPVFGEDRQDAVGKSRDFKARLQPEITREREVAPPECRFRPRRTRRNRRVPPLQHPHLCPRLRSTKPERPRKASFCS
jgi:hypothetical protein